MIVDVHKVFLITGVSSGFGLAFSQAALTAGHPVVGTVRRKTERVSIQRDRRRVKKSKFSPLSQPCNTCRNWIWDSIRTLTRLSQKRAACSRGRARHVGLWSGVRLNYRL
jgi:NAD(P)-dependent dehydrogenase (short-subunit alcohol dehydrogenase family)